MNRNQLRAQGLDKEMSRYLNQIAQEDGCLHVILFSSDGLVQATSDNIPRDVADRTAANLSGVQSLSQELAEFCDADQLPWQRTIVDMGDHVVLVFAAGNLAYVAVSIAAPLGSDQVLIITNTAVKAVNSMRHKLGTQERHSA